MVKGAGVLVVSVSGVGGSGLLVEGFKGTLKPKPQEAIRRTCRIQL